MGTTRIAALTLTVVAFAWSGRSANAQFVPLDDNRAVWAQASIFGTGDSHEASDQMKGPKVSDWAYWAAAQAILPNGNFSAVNAKQSSSLGGMLISGQTHIDFDFLAGPDEFLNGHAESGINFLFQLDEPKSVIVYSRLEGAVNQVPPFSGGNLLGTVSLKRFPAGEVIVEDSTQVVGIGNIPEITRSFTSVLQPGLWEVQLTTNAFSAQRAHGDSQLEVIIGCDQSRFDYDFPLSGVTVNTTIIFGGKRATQPVTMTGSVTGTKIFDCLGTLIGLRLNTLELDAVEPSITWTINPDISVTISDIHASVAPGHGLTGTIAPVTDECCGTLHGVAPIVTGTALVEIFGSSSTIPVSFLFPGLYDGIPFTLSSVLAGDETLELDVSFEQVADFGLGESNPLVIWEGSIIAQGNTCIAADLNCDGVVDGADLGALLGSWTSPTVPACGGAVFPCPADLDLNGVVDGADLGSLLGEWTT